MMKPPPHLPLLVRCNHRSPPIEMSGKHSERMEGLGEGAGNVLVKCGRAMTHGGEERFFQKNSDEERRKARVERNHM